MLYRVFSDYYKSLNLTQEDIAEYLGTSLSYVNIRFRGERAFTIEDIYTLCEKMDIPYEQIPYYFPKGGKLDFSTQYQQKMYRLKSVNPLTFADVLIKAGKAMKTIEQSELADNVVSLFDTR